VLRGGGGGSGEGGRGEVVPYLGRGSGLGAIHQSGALLLRSDCVIWKRGKRTVAVFRVRSWVGAFFDGGVQT